MSARPATIRLSAALAALAVVAAGCGSGDASSAKQFSGEQKAVATTVEDIQKAASKRDQDEICDHLLSKRLVDQITKASKKSCTKAVDKALQDIDSYELEVQRGGVAIRGSAATAKVKSKDGDDSYISTLVLIREDGRWKLDKL